MGEYILSVIINCEGQNQRSLEKTIKSLICQYKIEIILLNFLDEKFDFMDKNIKIINVGSFSTALKQATSTANGQYVYIFSAGDYFYKDSLNRMLKMISTENYDFFHCSLLDSHYTYQIEKIYGQIQKITYSSQQINNLPIKFKGCFFKKDWILKYVFSSCIDNSFEIEFMSKLIDNNQINCLKYPSCVVAYADNSDLIPFQNSKNVSIFLATVLNNNVLNKYQEYYILNEVKKYLTKSSIKYHKECLNESEKSEFLNIMKVILSHISIESILDISSIIMPYKNYLLSLKYGENYIQNRKLEFVQYKSSKGPYITYEKHPLFSITGVGNFKINILESNNNILTLDGLDSFSFLGSNYQIVAIDDKEREYIPEIHKWTLQDKEGFLGENVYRGRRFKFEIPLNQIKLLKFKIKDNQDHYFDLVPSFGKYAKLVKKHKMSFYAKDNYIFRYRKKGISISNRTWKSHFKAEAKFMAQLFKQKELKMIVIRILYYFFLLFKRKPIWLMRDNEKRAKDSGAEMFKFYSTSQIKKDINAYFILDKKCPDYHLMKRYGKIIQPDSFRYKLYHLLADKLIDTRGGINAEYIFKEKANCVMDLCRWDYIWLIHGIMTRNESTWTNKFVLNAKLFATCNVREQESILDENNGYGYDEKEVFLTGLPRHDALYANKQKKILFLPTWRKHLAGDLIPGTSDRSYVENFKENDFFQFYNNLINDPRLLKVMRDKGYQGDFYLHPSFMKQCNDFVENDVMKVGKKPADTNTLIGECSLLITDYSSAQFEGAYLDTPVIYPQYDADTFGENHTGKDGYFDYEKDGFGPVCYDLDKTVQTIIDYINNDCQNIEPYKTRASQFFVHRDQNNSQRVFEQILKNDNYLESEIKITEDAENIYLYQGEELKNAVIHEESYKLYNPLFHLNSYVKHIKMGVNSFSIEACIILDERDFKLPHHCFKINIGPYSEELKWIDNYTNHGKRHYRFKIEVSYKDILLAKKSTPIYICWVDQEGYGYRGYLKYQFTKRIDSLANRKNRKLHYSNITILEEIKSSIFIRETMGNNVYLCVRDINKTDYPDEQKKLKNAYNLSRLLWFHKARKSVLCFEKFASKYEESASVLFEKIIDERHKNTFFIIDVNSHHYQQIPEKYRKYIIAKYSFKHYFYFFLSKMFIATESMNHIIELNIGDPNVTLKITRGEYDYIFLQHGVMYMYCLENRSDFIKGQGFTKHSKVVVSSQIEANHFIEYGFFEQSDLIISGLPKFDRNHRNETADKILIMPTSRDFEYNVIRLTPEDSSYYKFVKNIINAVPTELKSKIVVVGHPLLKDHLASTDLKEFIPDNYIYNDLLEDTRLLITDYSSISYDAFYRGSNVIFCWEDKELCLKSLGYKLMLNDENVFSDVSRHFSDLTELIKQNYYAVQSEEHIEKYRNIVTYHDNHNTQRCYQALLDSGYYGHTHRVNLAKCQIKNFTKKVFSGEKRIHTKIELWNKDRILVANRDYQVYYFNNKRKTKFALALFLGRGKYYGYKIRRFRICESIMDFQVAGIEFVNNQISTHYISVKNNRNHYLRKDIDYVVDVQEGQVSNTIMLIIQGKKLYAGKIKILFKLESD